MNRFIFAFMAVVFCTVGVCGAAQSPTIITPDKVHWVAGTGPMAGAEMATLSGDPSKGGPYTIRLRLPANTKFAPHFHGDVENVTVISGTLWVGVGDAADASKMLALPAGSYVSVPKGLHHYAMTKVQTVIQIHGDGPMTMEAVKSK